MSVESEASGAISIADASASPPVRFHLSLSVRDLEASIRFYQLLFDRAPAKRFDDYAKFEVDDPPLVLSLAPHRGGVLSHGMLNHLGLRVGSFQTLLQMQERLEIAGLRTTREEGVSCCHSNQTKFWVVDPDGMHWEMYLLDEEEHASCEERPAIESSAPAGASHAPVTWEHHLGAPLPAAIDLPDGAADEILLRGSFNDSAPLESARALVADAFRALRPGGKLTVHALVGDRVVPDPVRLSLPGPAAAVREVPREEHIPLLLRECGFSMVRVLQFSTTPVFHLQGVEMRELLIEGRKGDASSPFELLQSVLYKGPLARVEDDAGNVYETGVRVNVACKNAGMLREGSLGEAFLVLLPRPE